MATLAAQGLHSVIDNRSDGEADDQPTDAVREAALRQIGLDHRTSRSLVRGWRGWPVPNCETAATLRPNADAPCPEW